VLQRAASRVGGLDIGFVPQADGLATNHMLEAVRAGKLKTLYLLGADEVPMAGLEDRFVIYQGHHGDVAAHYADVILPGAAYTEKDATYVNLEGRVQRAYRAVFPVGLAREDWLIVAELAKRVGVETGFSSLRQVRDALVQHNELYATIDTVQAGSVGSLGKRGKYTRSAFENPIANFYMTDVISRSSKTMAACAEAFVATTEQKVA
jgi:NADH-quinone oxidoreductase subunit G